MSSDTYDIPTEIQGLTEDDKALLRAFLEGSAFVPYQKLVNDGLFSLYRQIEAAANPQEMFRLQGRIQGLRYCLNALFHLTGAHPKDNKLKTLRTSDPPKGQNPSPRGPRDPRLPA
jgi:hypothetical protein